LTIDGEAVVLCHKTGLSLFDELHSGRRDRDVILYAFDLIELDGADVRPLPLIDRKVKLGQVIGLRGGVGGLEVAEHIEADGPTVFRHACRLGCEGMSRRPGKCHEPFQGW
jgi:bifunctional non-homologous end joining protein LigD